MIIRRFIMIVGVPKEIMHGEDRVSSTPETVAKMVADGCTVLVEAGAGKGAFFTDEQYAAAGGKIVSDVAEIYEKADVILKVKEPLFNEEKGCSEIDMMHDGQYLITFIHPAAPVNHEMVKAMAKKGVISLTLDGIPRISRAQKMDALSSMSTCAGYKGILMGASDLPKFMPMIMSSAGTIKPCNVLVIGTGVAGLRALATAKGLGAKIFSADIRPVANENATSFGAKIIELGIPEELAVGKGGYALALPPEWLQHEREVLAKVVPDMDIIFCSALVQGKLAPVILTDEMVASMKPGSAIVDISIDQGGNCAITDAGERSVKHDVTIEGIKNIPGMLPTSSTWMFANNIYELLKYLTKDGKIVLDMDDEIVSSIITTIGGEIVHTGAKEAMGIA